MPPIVQPTVPVSPFHAGEVAVQERLGTREIEAFARRAIRDHFPQQHRDFHTSLPFLVIGARDAKGRPWASILTGQEGFVTAPDDKSLHIAAQPSVGDALHGALTAGVDLGILGIELATRRRNRVNGLIAKAAPDGLSFAVSQTFGNCPQYIRQRGWHRVEQQGASHGIRSDHLTPAQQATIRAADTFFIASGTGTAARQRSQGMDVSHRGGEKGFVEVLAPDRIRFPDYAGNKLFNTIGNLVEDPRAGFLFVDFATGRLLQMTGETSIDWAPDTDRFPSAHRLVTLDIAEVVEVHYGHDLRWDADARSIRSLKLVEKVAESADVTSFYFASRDGGALPGYEAGQHLALEVPMGDGSVLSRSYSLSGDPADGRYRISVKREPNGLASRRLHDGIEVDTILSAHTPAGDLVLPDGTRPVILVGAGIGITPMISMAYALRRSDRNRRVELVQTARDRSHLPLGKEAAEIMEALPEGRYHLYLSREPGEEARVSPDHLAALDPDQTADFIFCGPSRFMTEMTEGLIALGVAEDRLHQESFGPNG